MKCLIKDCPTRSFLLTCELCYPCMQDIEKGRREWVSLTEEEVESWDLPELPTLFEFCSLIEAKIKEKNL